MENIGKPFFHEFFYHVIWKWRKPPQLKFEARNFHFRAFLENNSCFQGQPSFWSPLKWLTELVIKVMDLKGKGQIVEISKFICFYRKCFCPWKVCRFIHQLCNKTVVVDLADSQISELLPRNFENEHFRCRRGILNFLR